MLPLAHWPAEDRRRIVGVFTDIDDTLTTEGAITPDALQALADLRAAGLHTIAITGRPVGWSEPFAATWSVQAIVAENGAVALIPPPGASPHPCPLPEGEGENPTTSLAPLSPRKKGDGGKPASSLAPLSLWERAGARAGALQKIYQQDAATRARNFTRLQQVAQRVLREIPGTTLAQDSPGRETDIAIDHGEFAHLSAQQIEQVVQLMRSEGMHATVSSIHINGWYGAHDKLAGARWIVRALLGRDLDAEMERWVYVGDSTNDQLMFQHFRHSVGVANIRRFEAQLDHPPRYITPGERGAGFAEVVRALLSSKAAG